MEGTVTSKRNQYRLEYCESASQLVYQVEREFDLIEKKYNKLIEQKTVFAKRALARIHYILQEGSSDEDHIVKLINLLDHHANSPQVLEQMRDRIRVGTQFKNITDRSFYFPGGGPKACRTYGSVPHHESGIGICGHMRSNFAQRDHVGQRTVGLRYNFCGGDNFTAA